MKIVICFAMAYLVGSIPFAYLFTYFLIGKDITKIGTKNPGAANVAREVGKKWGVIVWLGDMLKGIFPLSFAYQFGISNLILLTLIGITAITGHCFSIFLKFKGGKGAATMGGVILYLIPELFPLVIILWFLAQKINPRSVKVLLFCILFFFLALFLLSSFYNKYKNKFPLLTICVFIMILFGLLKNIDLLKEIKSK